MSRREPLERTRRATLAGLGLVLLLAAPAQPASHQPSSLQPASRPTAVPHITLESSTPGDEEVVDGEVTEVRLFFSDAPLMRGASIRIVNSSRKLVRSHPPEADADDPKQLSVQRASTSCSGAVSRTTVT